MSSISAAGWATTRSTWRSTATRHRTGHFPDRADHRRTALAGRQGSCPVRHHRRNRLDGYDGAFDTVVDSGCYHCLDDDGRAAYAVAVHRATRPGATLLLSAFSDANATAGDWPRPMVSEEQLRQTLGDAGWTITSLESITVHRTDDTGSDVEMAFWLVQAQRV